MNASNTSVLIDSHVLIWLLYEPEKISAQATKLLQEADSVYLSVVSMWELALKFKKKKLAYAPEDLIRGAKLLNLEHLALQNAHILKMLDIQLLQKDPFDNLLLAQSQVEGCIFLTNDANILKSSYKTHSV